MKSEESVRLGVRSEHLIKKAPVHRRDVLGIIV